VTDLETHYVDNNYSALHVKCTGDNTNRNLSSWVPHMGNWVIVHGGVCTGEA